MKPQAVRLWDVAIFGPVMLLAATRLPPRDSGLAIALAAIGLGTVLYNGRNYLLEQKRTPR